MPGEIPGCSFAGLIDLARECTKCRACFQADDQLRAPTVDIAQPTFVPTGYWSSAPRVLIIGQNPGAGANRADGADARMRSLLRAFRDGDDSAWNRYVDHCEVDQARWGQYLRYLEAAGLNPMVTALGNAAMCAFERDHQTPEWALYACSSKYLARWIEALEPDIVILMGKFARSLRGSDAVGRPRTRILESMHYAVRGSHRSQLSKDLGEIKDAIEQWRASR